MAMVEATNASKRFFFLFLSIKKERGKKCFDDSTPYFGFDLD